MIDENNIRDEIIDSLNDSNVPNNPSKIKTLYLDRVKERNKPWYKYRRIYAIGGPVLAATLAVAVVVPVALSTKNNMLPNNAPGETYAYSSYKIEGSNNQIAFATLILGNAVNSLDSLDKLPSEFHPNSAFNVVKDIYILNSYMYSIEELISEEFSISYSTSINETNTVDLSIENSSVSSTYKYVQKASYNGEENYSLDGVVKTNGKSYELTGNKSGMFGWYNNEISMYVNEEKTYGFKAIFNQDLLSSQEITLKEFRDEKTLSTVTLSLVTKTSTSGNVSYSVNASLDGMNFNVYKLPDNNLKIDIFNDNKITDSFLVEVDRENDKYSYIYNELGLDINLKRK